MDITTIGIDVSKKKLDIYFSDTKEYMQIMNEIQGFRQLRKKLGNNYKCAKIIIEHTGGYQNKLVRYLKKEKYLVYLTNPKNARDFAKATGKLAKTDKIDAKMLALFGQCVEIREYNQADENQENLRCLYRRRLQILQMIIQEKGHIEKFDNDKYFEKEIQKHIENLEKMVLKVEEHMMQIIKEDQILLTKYRELTSVCGVGFVTACGLLAELRELGNIGRRQIAALVGVAPMNKDSGNLRGRRVIQKGRMNARNALYLAIRSAIQHNKVIKPYYQGLKQRGKAPKMAMVACMRKLLIHLNSKLQKLEV